MLRERWPATNPHFNAGMQGEGRGKREEGRGKREEGRGGTRCEE
jgi:hypothetical protein